MRGIRDVWDVAERQLCSGCGACAYVEPEVVCLEDVADHGIRPSPMAGVRAPTPAALRACPGISLPVRGAPQGALPELLEGWGPILDVYEGHARDRRLRWSASSGGVATALALHALEREGMHGVLHITARPDVPYLNRTVLSTTASELLAATGSRYAPASPCDSLSLVEAAPAPCVFIGKPCDVAGAVKAAEVRPALAPNLGLTIALFCAGTPSTAGTLEMLERMGISDPNDIKALRYRGEGWPGSAVATVRGPNGTIGRRELTYDESWNQILQKHRPWRCHICPDHTGEFADVSVGDPWYQEIAAGEPGRSLILVRTVRGQEIVARAAEMLELTRADPSILLASQPNLLAARGATWGRTATTRALGIPTPRYDGMPIRATWRHHLSAKQKVRSVSGTLRRVVRRRLFRRSRMPSS